MKAIIIGIVVLMTPTLINAQQFEWVNSVSGELAGGGDAIASDDENNIYSTGLFSGIADFDPGEEEYLLASEGFTYANSTFILKLDVSGDFVWVEQSVVLLELAEPEINECISYDLLVNNAGELYITGNFVGKTDFDPNPAENYELTSEGWIDHFLLKLNQNFIGINENSSQIAVAIYPNPIINNITIEVEGDFEIELFSIDGKLILNEPGLNGTYTIHPNLASGTYLLNVIQNKGVYSSKIVVQ
ncbi:MAG: T9SS type A sorting domain-containing protein [Crocinitomix sp.]|nr:T9SS type A sorting domain-containing protein [Crocinitomix sp.]